MIIRLDDGDRDQLRRLFREAEHADGIIIDGIPLRDRGWLDRDLSGQS